MARKLLSFCHSFVTLEKFDKNTLRPPEYAIVPKRPGCHPLSVLHMRGIGGKLDVLLIIIIIVGATVQLDQGE